MAGRKIQTAVPYAFTKPGIAKFYETMDSTYLQRLWHEKERTRQRFMARLAQKNVADNYVGWCCERIGTIEGEMLTIQQILNARRIKG